MSSQLIEVLKSSDTHNKWDDVAVSLRSGFKDQTVKINQISSSLMVINNYINKSGRQLISMRDKPIEYIKMICKQKNLSYSETPRNGLNCLELSGDCFRIVIVVQDSRLMPVSSKSDLIKQVLIEYNKEKPTSCPELLKSLSEGDYSFLLVHIEELLQLYSVGNDRTQQLKAFLCLQSLEEDINKLSHCQILPKQPNDTGLPIPPPTNIIGIIKPRSGGIPSQFVFYCPKNASNSDNGGTDSERFNIMVQLMPHSENNLLPFIPLVNLQKDAKGNCAPSYVTADSLKCVSLAAKFVLKLSRPLVVSDANLLAIKSITGLTVITTKDRTNYVDLILEQAGSSLVYQDRFYSILPNDVQIVFQIVNESAPFNANVVVSIPFLLPSQLPKIIAILKKQSIFNMMMESFLLTNAKEEFERDCIGAHSINIQIVSHDELICSFAQLSQDSFRIKFSISYNEYGQSSVKLLCPITSDNRKVENPQKVVQVYNNLPMVIFWLLRKSGSMTVREMPTFSPMAESANDKTQLEIIEKENDYRFLKECVNAAKANVNIRSVGDRELFPKIKIEPKLELLTTTFQQQIVHSPSIMSHHDVANSVVNKLPSSFHEQCLPQAQDYQPPFQNQYLQHQNNCQIPGQSGSNVNAMPNPIPGTAMNCGLPPSQLNQIPKNEPYQPYLGHGNKHMSLDQMLSSDFAMPLVMDNMGAFNSMSHSMHYQEHPGNIQNINNPYGNHMGNFKDSPNSKTARQLETQSSVLVNLLNCNENSSSSNSNLMSRQISNPQLPQCFPPNNYLNDQLDPSKNMQSQMLRGAQIPRMRMPHPNQSPKPNIGTPNYSNNGNNNNPPPVPPMPINRSPSTCKSDIMMMPYPQDTGTVRGVSIRKPRKRRAPNLELNQRLPKLQTPQFPMIQQPTPQDAMHLPAMQMNHMQPNSLPMANPNQTSSSNLSFSSPTTMDQSVYDFDDNVEFSRIRTVSTNSNISPHSMTGNSRRASGSGSKKPLKVKISRKIISQNNPSQDQSGMMDSQMSNVYEPDPKSKEKAAMCRSNTMPNISNIILSAPSSTSSVNTVIGGATTTASSHNHSRPTAIMSAIDSPLTCSSMSSMQASPYGSVNMSSQHNLPGTADNCDGAEIKKRRKRKIKPEQGDEVDAAGKREKVEARKQSKKKKELGAASGMSSHSSLENLAGLVPDSSLKPPLPIKLSVNTKMGSVSNSSARNPKIAMPNSNPTVNQAGAAWPAQTGSTTKQSSKELKSVGEQTLRNYKIPKKKSSDNSHPGNPGHESGHGSMSSKAMEHVSQKLSKEVAEAAKSEMLISTFGDRTKSPDLSMSQSSFLLNSDQDSRSSHDTQSSSSTRKEKSIHDIADRLILARTSGATPSNTESVINSNSTPANDLAQIKLPEQYLNSNNQNNSENIFEKFSSSKPNPKSDHRQIPGNRFPEPSSNALRYPYQRPQGAYPSRPPVAPAPFNYGPRPPYANNNNTNNPGVYRMENTTAAAAAPRNFPPAAPLPGQQYHKKTGNSAGFPPNRKK